MARLLNPLRKMIQSKLTEIEGLESGIIVSQDLVETGRYYFGYDIRTSLNRRFPATGSGSAPPQST